MLRTYTPWSSGPYHPTLFKFLRFVLLKAYHYTTKTTLLREKNYYEPFDCLSSADYFERPAAQRGEPQHRHCVDNEKVTNLEFQCALIDVICLYSMAYSMFFVLFSPQRWLS